MNHQQDNLNLTIVDTGAKKKRAIRTKPAARQHSEKDSNASSSTKSPLSPEGAPDAHITKPKANAKLAKFLVEKFIPEHLIVWGRDMSIACKLAVAYPNETFWRNFEIKRQVPSMAMVYTLDMRKKLKRIYDDYEATLEKQKNFVVDEPSKAWSIGEKCGEDFIAGQKPSTLKNFLK
jgi:hypothetical protein